MSHRSPRYLYDRFRLFLHQKRHPNEPWMAAQAVELLRGLLRNTDVALEWGAGRSTPWLSSRVRHLTSVEHDPEWHAQVKARCAAEGRTNIDHVLAPFRDGSGGESPYVAAVARFPDGGLDIAIVDGADMRVECAMAAVPKLAPGGLLILDNAQLYVDHPSRAPNSRYRQGDPEGWGGFVESVRTWRLIWTTNGVWDTAIWIKAGSP
jgi:predicted O-methyltransferase YrrM